MIHFAAQRRPACVALRDSNHGMRPHPSFPPPPGDPVPQILRNWLQALRPCFTAQRWEHALVLAPGERTVSARLRMTGRAEAGNFSSYHQTLDRARWNPGATGRRLLIMIVDRRAPDGPVVNGMHDATERRWGCKITARHPSRSHGRGTACDPRPNASQALALAFLVAEELDKTTPPRRAPKRSEPGMSHASATHDPRAGADGGGRPQADPSAARGGAIEALRAEFGDHGVARVGGGALVVPGSEA